MTNFCTLFDHNYLSRALVLYESLTQHCSDDFTLYVLATDSEAYDWLSVQNYKNITVQSLADIQSAYPVLERLRAERTRAEFSWTLSSFSIQFFLRKFDLPSVTYLDADICFYADPQILFDELDGESVIITPHNYTSRYDQTATSGRYCVQFMYFKNDAAGNEVLEWWRNECEKCCCGTPTNGKFGDQKYLDDWLSRFSGKVHEEQHMGCGIAPWNVQQFDIVQDDSSLIVIDKITKLQFQMIFYHFHGLRDYFKENHSFCWDLSSYELSEEVIKIIYEPYLKKLLSYKDVLPPENIKTIRLLSDSINNLPVYIYGAGVLGGRCCQQLKDKGRKINGFVVTSKSENPHNLMGIPVLSIHELADKMNSCEIIVAVKKLYETEVLELLKKMNFKQVRTCYDISRKLYAFNDSIKLEILEVL